MTTTRTQSEFCFIDNTKLKELTKECKTYIQKVLDNEKELDEIQDFDTAKTVNEQPVVNEVTNEDAKDTSVEDPQDTNDNKSVFSKLKGGRDRSKKKAFKLFAGLMKDAESVNEDVQHKEESSSEATVAYQPAVANNLYGNTGVTNQISFSPASEFRTVEERISELSTRLMMETDRNKILYIVNQIINLVPDKEAFKKTLLSKLKGDVNYEEEIGFCGI